MLDTSLESVENSNNDWVSCNWNDFSSKGIVVLISGNGSNLQALIDYGFEIKKVFSNNLDMIYILHICYCQFS